MVPNAGHPSGKGLAVLFLSVSFFFSLFSFSLSLALSPSFSLSLFLALSLFLVLSFGHCFSLLFPLTRSFLTRLRTAHMLDVQQVLARRRLPLRSAGRLPPRVPRGGRRHVLAARGGHEPRRALDGDVLRPERREPARRACRVRAVVEPDARPAGAFVPRGRRGGRVVGRADVEWTSRIVVARRRSR